MSIRLRLALLYTAVLATTLVLSNLVLYGLMARHFHELADESVAEYASHVASTIQVPAQAATAASSSLHNLLLPPIDAFAGPGVYVQVLGADGLPIARSSNLGTQALPVPVQALEVARSGRASYDAGRVAADEVRVYTQPIVANGQIFGFVQVARSYHEDQATLGGLRLAMLGVGVASLLLTGFVSWAMAGRALRPVATLTHTARAIALSRGFSRRVPDTASRDELGELARTFNEMLGSLEEAYAAQQRFVADASHELRTPLTAVRGNLELLKTRGDEIPAEERRALVEAASAEAERMARLVSDLLALARADAGQKLSHKPVELDRVLLDVFQQARGLARAVKLSLRELDQLAVLGDVDQLKQLLLALVDNALKYTPAGGTVSLGLRREGPEAVIEVRDTGIGIAPADLPHVFERFYRADKARSRDAGGTGLGLAIARWIAQEHGGAIAVASQAGQGSTFTVRLPVLEVAGSGGQATDES